MKTTKEHSDVALKTVCAIYTDIAIPRLQNGETICFYLAPTYADKSNPNNPEILSPGDHATLYYYDKTRNMRYENAEVVSVGQNTVQGLYQKFQQNLIALGTRASTVADFCAQIYKSCNMDLYRNNNPKYAVILPETIIPYIILEKRSDGTKVPLDIPTKSIKIHRSKC